MGRTQGRGTSPHGEESHSGQGQRGRRASRRQRCHPQRERAERWGGRKKSPEGTSREAGVRGLSPPTCLKVTHTAGVQAESRPSPSNLKTHGLVHSYLQPLEPL